MVTESKSVSDRKAPFYPQVTPNGNKLNAQVKGREDYTPQEIALSNLFGRTAVSYLSMNWLASIKCICKDGRDTLSNISSKETLVHCRREISTLVGKESSELSVMRGVYSGRPFIVVKVLEETLEEITLSDSEEVFLDQIPPLETTRRLMLLIKERPLHQKMKTYNLDGKILEDITNNADFLAAAKIMQGEKVILNGKRYRRTDIGNRGI